MYCFLCFGLSINTQSEKLFFLLSRVLWRTQEVELPLHKQSDKVQ